MLSFLDKVPYGTAKIRRVIFWLLTTFICYSLFGFFAVPPILKSVILGQIDDALKRPAQIEEIYFNPYIFHIEITGLQIHKLEGDGNLVSASQMIAAPGISTIWKFAPVISYLHLKDLIVDITFFGDGKYSISDLMGSDNPPNETGQEKKPEEKGTVFPFALYGFEMTNAKIIFDDRPHDKKHVISDIFLRVPFTSSFVAMKKEFTQPKFTAVVNGDPVELKGRTLPFDETLLTEFELGAVDIKLDQYWSYVPIETPLKLKKGRFTSDISLFFQRPNAQRLNLFLGGGGKLIDLELQEPKAGSVLTMKELSFEMERFSLGDNALVLKSVSMQAPFFRVIRNKNNTVNWSEYFPGASLGQAGPEIKTSAENDSAFIMDIRHFEIKDGVLDWVDHKVPGGFERVFNNFNFTGTEISTHGDRPSAFTASAHNEGMFNLTGTGTMDPIGATATLMIKDIPLPVFKPYINQHQPLIVDSGQFGLTADIDFKMQEGKPHVAITNGNMSLDKLAVRKPNAEKPSFTMTALNVSGASFDLLSESVKVGEIKVTAPAATVVREKDGRIDLHKLFVPTPSDKATSAQPAPASPDEAPTTWAGGWNALIENFIIEDGSATFLDRVPMHKATLGISKFELDLKNISTEKDSTIPYTVNGAWSGRGSFSTQGEASIEPLWANGKFRLSNFGLRPLDSYLAQYTDMLIAKGAAHANLKYSFTNGETPKITAGGDAALSSLQIKTTFDDDEFIGIDKLDLKGIAFESGPNSLSIGEINLDGPRALIEFAEDGRLNMRRALRIPEPPPVVEGEEDTKKKGKKAAPEPEPEVVEVAEKVEEGAVFAKLDIGKIGMTNGTIHFKDASVTPDFATEIKDMTLILTDIGQTREARPKMDFKANIGPTPMSVTGVLNPVITPIYSDLSISINGMELVPLTPYTVQSLAYPIEKGRLYADVAFKTENWELDAKNKFFIEQLVLGPKDKRPDAPSVPVKFGLALLQDSNGDMELNLPISGRLDDPNFRIGGIVFKAIVSLLFKALASPFSLIGSIFGGGGENMDFVVFEPGRAKFDAAGEEKMTTIIKALTERKKLKLEVDGVIDPIADKSGLVQAIFEHKLKEQKYLSLLRKERAETTVEAMVIAPEEYQEFLFEAYAEEPDEEGVKPTTLFMVDEQPVEVMEKFIRDRIIITDELLHELAMRRANAVKSYILERQPALTERVFLLDRKDAQGKVGVPAHRADLGIN